MLPVSIILDVMFEMIEVYHNNFNNNLLLTNVLDWIYYQMLDVNNFDCDVWNWDGYICLMLDVEQHEYYLWIEGATQ